ncbi:MAG: hypothetical protein E2P06_06160 [Acidobacteria bacterium]|nr:MAG: hypothetical protein E2P06_06160 [Acidobacteriota bacterium]
MRHSPLVAVLTVVAIVLLSSGPAAAQAPPAASDPPRTADGRPDLSGVWAFRTVTPLDRPSALADKAFFTEEEAAAFASQRVEASNVDLNRSTTATDRRVNGTIETIDLRSAYNNFWYDRGDSVVGTRRTSLVVDPPDGRIPDVTPQARERAAARAARSERLSEGPEDRSLAERCIMGFNSGPPIAPAAYNQNVQIFQTPNTVVLLNEMVHNARLVPLDGRPHGTIRQWAGDSRGRWPLHRDVVVGRRQPGTDAERIGADRALARGAVRNARLARRSQPSRDGLRRSLAQRYRSPPMRLADPPRNSRWPSDSVKFRPTALGVPSLAW